MKAYLGFRIVINMTIQCKIAVQAIHRVLVGGNPHRSKRNEFGRPETCAQTVREKLAFY